ncbi:MAG: hypothetical protein V4449_00065 [Patescibacteria group bacterium]
MKKREGLKVTEQTPSAEMIDAYLAHVGREVFSNELEHLTDDRFEHGFDEVGEREGWKGLKMRALVQGVVAVNLGKLLNLSKDDQRILSSAAVLNMPMRRVQYKRHKVEEITTAEREAIDKEGSQVLLERGVDPLIVEVAGASDTRFSHEAGGGWIQPQTEEEKRLYFLKKLLLYIHTTVNPTKNLKTGEWEISIDDWKERLTGSAVEQYRTINAEQFPVQTAPGEALRTEGHFALEIKVVDEAEKDIYERLKKYHPELMRNDTPLWEVLKNVVHEDIQNSTYPPEVSSVFKKLAPRTCKRDVFIRPSLGKEK